MDLGIGPKPLHIRSRGGRWFWVKTGAATNRYFYGYFDVLFNNAGVMATKDYKPADGFEMHFASNDLSHWSSLAGLNRAGLKRAQASFWVIPGPVLVVRITDLSHLPLVNLVTGKIISAKRVVINLSSTGRELSEVKFDVPSFRVRGTVVHWIGTSSS